MKSTNGNICAGESATCGCTYEHPPLSAAAPTTQGESRKAVRTSIKAVLYSLGTILFAAGILLPVQGYGELTVFAAAYLLWGGEVLLRAGQNIIKGVIFDENFLMTVATLGAFGIGEYPEGVAVMIFYQIGEILQERAVSRSYRSIRELIDINPEFAHLRERTMIKTVAPRLVNVGDIIVVRPGEKIPLDGRVLEGTSTLDPVSYTHLDVYKRQASFSYLKIHINHIMVRLSDKANFLNRSIPSGAPIDLQCRGPAPAAIERRQRFDLQQGAGFCLWGADPKGRPAFYEKGG